MQKKLKIIIAIISISLCITFYLTSHNSINEEYTLDLTGSNELWKASLNIALNYNSELIIQPRRDDFDIPSQINIDVFIDDNSLYTDTLEYIPSSDNFLGKYMVVLDSNEYFDKDIDTIRLVINYDNESSTILLN